MHSWWRFTEKANHYACMIREKGRRAFSKGTFAVILEARRRASKRIDNKKVNSTCIHIDIQITSKG